MATENQNFGQPTTGKPQQTSGQGVPPAPIPMPYIPTPEEEAYLQACGHAITVGCEAAASAEAASNADAYLKFANGVKSLTAAYVEIKTGGKASTGHQGS